MTSTPDPTSLILVAILPHPRDLEIAKLLGWYRIPLRKAPKVVAVDYLAFYQPGSFGARGGQIEYIAPVRGHELTTRNQLLQDELEHPRAQEEYYRIQLGPLIRLPTPLPAGKWRRITFLYTTGEYLNQAETINDLVVQSDERNLLWQALRERALAAQDYYADQLPEKKLDPELMVFLGKLMRKGLSEDPLDYD